jgi:hypothetical protein
MKPTSIPAKDQPRPSYLSLLQDATLRRIQLLHTPFGGVVVAQPAPVSPNDFTAPHRPFRRELELGCIVPVPEVTEITVSFFGTYDGHAPINHRFLAYLSFSFIALTFLVISNQYLHLSKVPTINYL